MEHPLFEPARAAVAAPTVSFEFMPPRSAAATPKFWDTVKLLETTTPDFVSVTYGAGGHNRDTAHQIVSKMVRESPCRTLAHLTCVGAPRSETVRVIDDYLDSGVRAFLALRGDQPVGGEIYPDQLKSSVELIALVREREATRCQASSANALRAAVHPLIISVATFPAGNPAAGTTPTQEVERLLIKQAAGASFAITQLFYDPQIYTRFVAEARAAGVHIPILAGILPPTNPRRLRRTAELTGVQPDQALLEQLESATPEEQQRIGVQAGGALIEEILAGGAPGVHIYTFNQAEPTVAVLEQSGLIGATAPGHQRPNRCDWTPTPPGGIRQQELANAAGA